MEPNISELVLTIRDTPGWLVIVEDVAGKEIADRCERYDDALIEGEALAEEYYYETERQKVKEALEEWKSEMKDFATDCRERRTEELNSILNESKEKLAEILTHRGNTERKTALLKNIKRMESILENDITPEKIERAREYPLEQLVDIKNGMAKCINHEDRFPSMNCRKNFAYCHSCGFYADAIGVYMKLKGCGFIEAVNSLAT